MSQNAVQAPTTGVLSGLQNNQDINAALLAILSLLSGASAPTTTALSAAGSSVSSMAGFPWHDLTTNLLKIRDQADANWIVQGLVDETNKLWVPALRSYLAGLQLSNDATTPNTKIDVSAGICTDDTNAFPMSLAAGTIDFSTVGLNGLDAGTIAATTWYHLFAIGGSGKTPGFLASTSLSFPTMPSGYTYKRRLGSVKTDGSAHLLAFKQEGDIFQWSPVTDINLVTTSTTNRTLYTISAPPGVKTMAMVRYNSTCTTAQCLVVLTSPDEPDNAVTGSNVDLAAPQNVTAAGSKQILTNTSAQIGARSQTASLLGLETYGWIDRRGRDA